MNYKLLAGPFEGSVIEEGVQILDVDFQHLDDDIQFRVRDWAEDQIGRKYIEINGGSDFAYKGGFSECLSLNQIMRDYEASWDCAETDEKVDLLPASSWIDA